MEMGRMNDVLETARAKTGQRVAIRVSEVATLTECRGATSCVVTKRGDTFHIVLPYDDAAKLLGFREAR
jgi:hypothetical protein